MAALTQPSRVRLAQLPTPLRPLVRLTAEIGGPDFWVKRDDLTGAALSGNKVRKLEFSIAEALDRGADTLITCGGLQSNHCRTTAVAARQLGLRAHLVLRGVPEGTPDGNLFLDHLLGAEISTYPVEEYSARLEEIFMELVEEYSRQGHTAHVIPMGASDATGIWGYAAAGEELADDFKRAGIRPDHIVCATGSGGTQAGLMVGNAAFRLGAQVWGINVCDDEAYFVSKIGSDLRDWKAKYRQGVDVDDLPIQILDGHVGPGYARATAEIRETIGRVARTEGLVLDPVYTGKAFHGLLTEIERGRFGRGETVVFLHTGGIHGLFAFREEFSFESVRET
jgi:D-cysteine desulfhydrase